MKADQIISDDLKKLSTNELKNYQKLFNLQIPKLIYRNREFIRGKIKL